MIYLSKSKYCGLWQCPKIAWLRENMPGGFEFDQAVLDRMEVGNQVGDLAMGYFGDFVEIPANRKSDGKLDLSTMISATEAEMAKGTPVICEASFVYNGLFCSVDILKKENGGWAIYEVKSSVKKPDEKEDRPVYIADIAYQKYVLEHCGIDVTGTYLVQLDKEYVFDGVLDIHRLFTVTDVSAEIPAQEASIETNLRIAEELLSSPEEPDIDLSLSCNDPYPCVFWEHCTEDLPTPNVFDLYRLWFSKKMDCYRRGIIAFEDLIHEPSITNPRQLRQMEYSLSDKGTYVEKDNIRDFLSNLSYPLYFLDFETMNPAIPMFVGTRPYTQIPFQYSLHYIEREGGELKHKEFLAASGVDPRRAIAERLCEDIPMNVCVTAYYKSFECTRIKELAELFPDLADHLLNIRDNIVDLLVPFQSGYYYNREMGGSFSIKSVLPAVFPNDPELNYHNLEGVHNGGEAMNLFPKIKDMPPAEQAEARRNLLEYCKLDTLAMVKLWEELIRVSR